MTAPWPMSKPGGELERRLAVYVATLRGRVEELGGRGQMAAALTVRTIADELERVRAGAEFGGQGMDHAGIEPVRNLLRANGATAHQLQIFDRGARAAAQTIARGELA